MTVYATGDPAEYELIDRWEGGAGWFAHPDETIARASHVVATESGAFVFDPIDAPGVDDLIAEFGDLAGVAVGSSWHARDAGEMADRHDVPVWIPEWMERVEDRVDAPVKRYSDRLPGTRFRVRPYLPLPTWDEAILYRERDGTLYVPESLGTSATFRVGRERLGVAVHVRLIPPRKQLADLDPDRILVGHGVGVFEDADYALEYALRNARKRAPRAFLDQTATAVRQLVAASRN